MFSNVAVRSQGPAVTLQITNRNGRVYSVDLALAIKDKSWPEDAEEWKQRPRNGINGNLLLLQTFKVKYSRLPITRTLR